MIDFFTNVRFADYDGTLIVLLLLGVVVKTFWDAEGFKVMVAGVWARCLEKFGLLMIGLRGLSFILLFVLDTYCSSMFIADTDAGLLVYNFFSVFRLRKKPS